MHEGEVFLALVVGLDIELDEQGERALSSPIGRMILDPNGRFSTVTLRPGLPRFASNNRMQGTADEYREVVQGSNAFFGTYTVNEADKTIVFRVEFATFPSWNGDEQTRIFTLVGDELSYVNPTTTVGGGRSQLVWKRIR
jgi:hypothetical protein